LQSPEIISRIIQAWTHSPRYEIEQDEGSLYSLSKPQKGAHKRDCAGCQGLTKKSPADY